MAMHEPSSRVVSWVGNDEPSVSGHVVDITARGVVEVQLVEIPVHVEVSWTANTKDIHVVTVKMDRVRKTPCTVILLDDPVGPFGRVRNIDQVIVLGIVLVALAHVLKGGFGRVDDHGSAVNGPENDRLVVGGDSPVVKSEVQVLSLDAESILWHILHNLGRRHGVYARCWCITKRLACRISQGLTIIGEDRAANSVIGAEAWAVDFGAEPVVTSCLVCSEDNIVPLTCLD